MSSNEVSIAPWVAPAHWRSVDLLSDLHLHAGDPATLAALENYLEHANADAILFLGDLFEVWVGDDSLEGGSFEQRAASLLRASAQRQPLYFMHGNRDFLLSPKAAAQCGMQLLPDPVRFTLGEHTYLLSHGDALCLDDTDYMAFRATVRGAQWQQNFLAQPLAKRREVAAQMRAQSEARRLEQPAAAIVDVDAKAAADWLAQADCNTLIHGHTHRPAQHALPGGGTRVVLSDWDCSPQALKPRAEVLRLSSGGWQRVPLV